MYQTDNRIRIPALAIAMVMGVVSTFGLTALLEKASAPGDFASSAVFAATRNLPTEVAIMPARIDVIAVRSHEVAAASTEDEGQVGNAAEATVTIEPARVDVVAVREGAAHRHLLSAVFGKRAG